jgi:hypothetical protein
MKLPQSLYRPIALFGYVVLVTVSGLSACGVSSSSVTGYSVGGTVSGLGSGKNVVLQNDGADDLSVSADGSFTFATALQSGNAYEVTVLTQPADQTCTVGNGSGAVFALNVTDVAVSCVTDSHTIGGSVSGLGSGKSVVLEDNGGDDLAINADGTFTFATALQSGTAYNVTVLTPPAEQSCTVSNAGGTVSAADVGDVAVVCRAWGAAALIENDNASDATNPQVAVDVHGDAVAVWQQSDGSHTHIWANRYVAGSGWLTPILIETDDTADATDPQIAVDADGNAVAVWVQNGMSWSNRYTAGVGWSAAIPITGNSSNENAPRIGLDANGDAVAVWIHFDGAKNDVWANHYTAGWGWGTATTIGDGSGDAGVPQVGVDTNGNAVAVWQQSDGIRTNIWTNRYAAASGWGAAALIETNDAGDAANPQVAVDANGNAAAVWQQSDGSRTNIWANRYAAASGWGAAALIETDDTGDAANPQVAVDASGNAVAVWQQSDGIRTNIWANRYMAGRSWDIAALIESDNKGDAVFPRIGVDADGNAVAVWQQSDGIRTNIWANLYR